MDSCLRALKRCVNNNHSKLLWLNIERESSVKPLNQNLFLRHCYWHQQLIYKIK